MSNKFSKQATAETKGLNKINLFLFYQQISLYYYISPQLKGYILEYQQKRTIGQTQGTRFINIGLYTSALGKICT